MAKIHPSASVDPKAELAPGVEVGAYTVIGPHVKIGKDTAIAHHAVIEGDTQIGERCRIYSFACLGTHPQVRKQPLKSRLLIGDDNIIREYVTMNPGMSEEAVTRVGSKNFMMMNVHIAHDCIVGNEITIANCVALAGHVQIEDNVTIGGLSGVHQFVRIGKYAMIGGVSKVVADIPPFSTCDGHPAAFYGINALGLKRAGFSSGDRVAIRKSLKILFASGKKISTSIEEVRREFPDNVHVHDILKFLKDSKRGFVRARQIREEDLQEAG